MECTKCGHDPSTVKADQLQMLLAASMLVQRFNALAGEAAAHGATYTAGRIDAILHEFRNDSKGSTNQIERK